jgi:glycosyltransferase involved in cell wall biosynthesis
MSYHANISMVLYLVQTIMPNIWSHRPDVNLWIVGKDPPNEIRALQKESRITVTGTVSDIRPFLQKATIAVAPLTYGAGIQNKVLESMACAIPLISTPQAISAIGVQPGKEILVAQDPGEFADSILFLLENPQVQQRIGEAGRQYVEQNHRWSTITRQLEGVYDEVIDAKQRVRT